MIAKFLSFNRRISFIAPSNRFTISISTIILFKTWIWIVTCSRWILVLRLRMNSISDIHIHQSWDWYLHDNQTDNPLHRSISNSRVYWRWQHNRHICWWHSKNIFMRVRVILPALLIWFNGIAQRSFLPIGIAAMILDKISRVWLVGTRMTMAMWCHKWLSTIIVVVVRRDEIDIK